MKYWMGLVGGVVVVLGGMMVWARTALRPDNLGVKDGRLAALPKTPNCVATQSGEGDQRMAPIPYKGDRSETHEHLLKVIREMPRATVVENKPGYVAVVFQSAFFGFKDDAEFWMDDAHEQIHFRAAARLGHSDFGINRKRMEAIQKTLK